MFFDPKRTIIYQAVGIAKKFPPNLVKLVNWLLLIIALSLLIAFIGDKTLPGLSSMDSILGLFLIVLSFSILGWVWLIFFKTVLKENLYLKPLLQGAVSFS